MLIFPARRRPLAVLLGAAVALPAALAPSALAGTGTYGSTAGEPNTTCSGSTCTVASLDKAPADGIVRRWSIRHTDTPAGTTAALSVVRESGSMSYEVVRSAPAVSLPAGAAAQTSSFDVPDGLAVGTGQMLGVVLTKGAGGDVLVVDSASGPGWTSNSGSWSWGTLTSGRLLLSADVEGAGWGATGGGSAGGGSTGGGSAGGDAGTQTGTRDSICRPGTQVATARTAAVPAARPGGSLALDATATAARRGWRGQVVSKLPTYRSWLEARVGFDRRGRPHIAAKALNPHEVVVFGPGYGRKVVDVAEFSNAIALAMLGNRPLVAYGISITESEPTPPGIVGLRHTCDVLKTAVGPGFQPAVVANRGVNESAYQFLDVATSGGAVHLAYEAGDRLHYQRAGLAPEALPLTDVRTVRIDVRGSRVAIAAATDSSLKLFTRRGSGRWTVRTVPGAWGSWDMALGSDGRPRLAFQGRDLKLRLFDGRRVKRTGLYVSSLALAVGRGNALHVAFTKTSGPNCWGTRGWFTTCVGNGLFHLRANARATRGKVSVVQGSIGESPQLSIAVHGRRVAIAFPWVDGKLMLRRR